jgi:HlyD family secretion protein
VKKLLLLLLLIALGLAGAAYWHTARQQHAHEADRYTLAPVEYGRAAEVVSATGVVQPRDVYPAGTEVAGRVVEVLADFNQVVQEGDVLLRLDDRMARQRLRQAEVAVEAARAGVKQAEATRDTAQKAAQRVEEMSPQVRRQADVDVARGHLRAAEAGVDASRVKVEEAEAARQQAELALRLHTVRTPVLGPDPTGASAAAAADRPGIGTVAADAPPAGRKRSFVVLDRKALLNQEVGPPASAQLFTLAGDLDRMQVHAQVVEGDIGKIGRGMEARFTVPGPDGDAAFTGRVDEIRLAPANERGAVFYRVVVDVRNERKPAAGDWLLRPGLTASVDFLRRVHDPVWKVPAAALNLQVDPAQLTEAARAKLERPRNLPDPQDWRPVWVVGQQEKPWPVFVRVGGTNERGEPGIQDAQFSEVLGWDPELWPPPDPKDPWTWPRVIVALAPPKKGLFNPPNIKF